MIPPQETVLQRPYQCDRRRPSRGHPGGQDGRQGESDRSREEAWPGQGRAWWAGPGRWAGPGGQPTASPSQSASSERSWQSASPSQRSRRSTHWPRAQGNWAAEHTGQPSSSLWSSHSGKPSQRQAPGMQSISPVAQANWSGEQVGGSGEDRKTVTRAALPSAEKTEAARLVPRPLRLRCERPVCCPGPAGEEAGDTCLQREDMNVRWKEEGLTGALTCKQQALRQAQGGRFWAGEQLGLQSVCTWPGHA